jgi:hypothetical protein
LSRFIPEEGNWLQRDLAVLHAIPVVDAAGMDFDQHHVLCVDALLQPVVEVGLPVLLEGGAVADQLGLALDADENRGGLPNNLFAAWNARLTCGSRSISETIRVSS